MLKQPLIKSPTTMLHVHLSNGGKPTKNKRELEYTLRILKAASKGVKKAQLNHRCNLTPALFGKYVSALTELELLEIFDNGEAYYKTTDRGLELLHTYHKLRWLLWGGTFDFMLVGLLSRLKIDRQETGRYKAYIS
jgi:predicted transcriptional regulator